MKISQIAYTEVLGLPILLWGGMATGIMLTLTAAIGFLNAHGIRIIKFKYHKPTAYLTLALGLFHGLIGILAYLGF